MPEEPPNDEHGHGQHEAERLSPMPPLPQTATEHDEPRGAVRKATIDLGPLRRHRDFRLLTAAQAVTFLGSMVTYVALPYQAYQLSGSSLVVGLLGLAELCPLLVTAFLGGALADARDRRRMLLLTELSFAGTSIVLLLNATLASPQLWLLFVVAAVMAALDGLQRPSLEALIPRLVGRDEMPAAAAIGTLRFTIGEIAGPALGGVLIAVVGLPLTYAFDVATFAASLVLLRMMRAAPPPVAGAKVSLHGILEGLRYAAARPVLLGTYAVDIVAMFFGMPNAIFPAFAHEFGGAGVLGLMYAAPAAGAVRGHAHQRLDGRDAQARRGHLLRGRRLGARDRGGRAGARAGAGAGRPGGGGRRRCAVGHLPDDRLEPDHPRRAARAPGRHRAGQLLDRAAGRERRGGRRGLADRGTRIDRLGRRALRDRRGRHGGAAAGLLALRRELGQGRAGHAGDGLSRSSMQASGAPSTGYQARIAAVPGSSGGSW